MVDWFKVQMNEANRRISLEVYAENLVKAVEANNKVDIEVAVQVHQGQDDAAEVEHAHDVRRLAGAGGDGDPELLEAAKC